MNKDNQIFISYPNPNKDITENLKGRLKEYGVTAWVYSRDKTLLKNGWDEIEKKISLCKVFILIFSEHSDGASGQKRELKYISEQIKNRNLKIEIFPIIIGNGKFSELPENIRYINGLTLDSFNIKTCAFKIANLFFPESSSEYDKQEWKYPKPGQWLKICKIDELIEEYFNIGDLLYFRRISPMGLFECYSSKIDGLFWIYPPNVCISSIIDEDGLYERENVPEKYRFSTLIMAEYKYFNQLKT